MVVCDGMKRTVGSGCVKRFSKLFSFIENLRVEDVSSDELSLSWRFLMKIEESLMTLMGLSNEVMHFKFVEKFVFSNAFQCRMRNFVSAFSREEEALVVPCHSRPAVQVASVLSHTG